MELTITQRDKKLLVFLAVFLIVTGFLRFGIIPAWEKGTRLQEQISQADASSASVESAISLYSSLQGQYETLSGNWEEVSEDFYHIMSSQEIDRMLNGILQEKQAEAVSLNIEMENEKALLLKSYLNEEQENGKTGVSQPDSGTESQEDSVSEKMVCGAKINFCIQGTMEQLRDVLDSIYQDCPGIHVNSYAFSSTSQEGIRQLDLDMYLYMCDKESVGGAK